MEKVWKKRKNQNREKEIEKRKKKNIYAGSE